MSWSHQTNIGYSNGNFFTFGGYGQFVQRSTPSAEFIRRLKLPNATPVLIATIRAGWRLTAGRAQYGYGVGLFPIPDFPVLGVYVNGGTVSLPTPPIWDLPAGLRPDPSAYQFGYFDILPGTLTVGGHSQVIQSLARQVLVFYWPDEASGGGHYRNDYVAHLAVRVATVPKSFRSAQWEPRIVAAPNLSLRIEPKFGGPISQLGGGTLAIANADGRYDFLENAAWDVSSLTLEYGLDLPDSAMSESDYQIIGTWRVSRAERSDSQLRLELSELKSRVEAEIPFEMLTRETYPAINNNDIGKPIPLAYGHIFAAPATVLDRAAKRFKICLHRIRSLDAVRIRQTVKSAETETITGVWATEQTSAYVTNYGHDILTVYFGATELTKKTSIAAVAASAGSWYQENELLYVRPPGASGINDDTITVRKETSFQTWVASSFASKNLEAGEFTLGSDWDRDSDVSVDFQGRVKADGTLMENWADIVADLLDYLGETRFDAQSFNQARRELTIGATQIGLESMHLAPSLYIFERKEAREILAKICETIGASLVVDASGAWRLNLFRAQPVNELGNAEGATPRTFAHTELADALTRIADSREVFSRVSATFAKRHAEGWSEMIEQSRTLNKALHGINEVEPEERELLVWRESDAQYIAQRLLTTEGEPLNTYQLTLPRHALFLLPADQIRLTHSRHGFTLALDASIAGTSGMDEVLEILSIDKDFVTGRVRVVAGDRRNWRDGFGWWMIEDANVPALPTGAVSHLKSEGLPYTEGQNVVTWFAPAGMRTASQGVAQFQPSFRANQINGLPALRFTKNGNFWEFLNLSGATIAAWTAGEIFLMLKVDADPGVSRNTIYHFGSAGVMQYPDGAGVIQETFGVAGPLATVNPASALTSWRLYNVSVNAAGFTQRLDGTQIFTTGAHAFGFTSGTPAIGGGSSSNGADCYIAEALLYDRVLSASERSAVVDYFNTRFNLGLAAPSNTAVQWNRGWTNAQASYARKNYGWWHDSVFKIANLSSVDNDPRAFEASRWW